MKKTLFAALALAFVASCSNEEVVEMAQKEAIGFDNAFVNNSTRSVNDPSITTDGANSTTPLANFAVFGFVGSDQATTPAVLFDGVEVNKTITNSELTKTDWKYAATQYWITGATYNFSAVAPFANKKWEKTAASKDGVTLSFENTGTQDLLYAQSEANITGQASNNPAVAFTFNHILSKVKFTFKNEYNATASTIRVKNIVITNPYKTGNVALTASTTSWTDRATAEGFTLNFGNAATTAVNAEEAFAYDNEIESYNELLLIPNTVEGAKDTYNVTFTVDLLVSGTVIKTYNHTATVEFKPEPGKSYDIKAVINAENIDPSTEQEPIEFTVTRINGWDNPNGESNGTTNDVDATVNPLPGTGEDESNTGGIGGN